MNEIIRMEFQFFGRVQGVGFRYKLSHLARGCGVSGWVRNEYDGSVTAQIQGREGQMDDILRLLMQDRYIDIQEIRKKNISIKEGEQGFQICY